MAIYTVREGQNLFDVAVQLYGDAQYLLLLCVDNNLGLTSPISGGDTLVYDDTILKQTNATLYLSLNSIAIVSADLEPNPSDLIDHNSADYTADDHN